MRLYRTLLFLVVATVALAVGVEATTCGTTIGPVDPNSPVTLATDVVGPCANPFVLRIIGPVVVDLNGHTISCGDATPVEREGTIGLLVEGLNAYVRNGSVTGCGTGVQLQGRESDNVAAHTILNITAQDNVRAGMCKDPAAA